MAVDNEKIVVAEFSDHELFTPIYHSFLRSKKLNGKEKLLYIVLKSFLDVGKREGKVFPTIETICDMVDMSKPTVVNILKNLKKKGVLKIEQRGRFRIRKAAQRTRGNRFFEIERLSIYIERKRACISTPPSN